MKTWYARIRSGSDYYGTWIPTGATTLEEAKEYMELFYRTPWTGGKPTVREWLQL